MALRGALMRCAARLRGSGVCLQGRREPFRGGSRAASMPRDALQSHTCAPNPRTLRLTAIAKSDARPTRTPTALAPYSSRCGVRSDRIPETVRRMDAAPGAPTDGFTAFSGMRIGTDAERRDENQARSESAERQPTHTRALRNIRIHPLSSPHVSGCQEFCTVRNTRSGCGIRIVARPSRLVRPVMPAGEPFGFAG